MMEIRGSDIFENNDMVINFLRRVVERKSAVLKTNELEFYKFALFVLSYTCHPDIVEELKSIQEELGIENNNQVLLAKPDLKKSLSDKKAELKVAQYLYNKFCSISSDLYDENDLHTPTAESTMQKLEYEQKSTEIWIKLLNERMNKIWGEADWQGEDWCKTGENEPEEYRKARETCQKLEQALANLQKVKQELTDWQELADQWYDNYNDMKSLKKDENISEER